MRNNDSSAPLNDGANAPLNDGANEARWRSDDLLFWRTVLLHVTVERAVRLRIGEDPLWAQVAESMRLTRNRATGLSP